MLSNIIFLETKIQLLFDGLFVFFFVEKGFAVQVLYTGGNFKQNVWKKLKVIGDLIYENDLTN